jgi:hypothetical protein
VREKVSDGRVLELLEAYLTQKVMETTKSWTPEGGTPQGAVISPLLSNLYLGPLDQQMAQQGREMVRYADDFIILCRGQAEAAAVLEQVRRWAEQAGLQLHPVKTRIVDATQKGGFDFLGYHFERGMKWLREKSLRKFKDPIRAKTRRTHGHSLKVIVKDVNRTLRDWFEYFKQSHRSTFGPLDAWVRMRLRSILRQRQRRKGRERRSDHQRLAECFLCQARVESSEQPIRLGALLTSIPTRVNHQLESRMREIRPSGSEGGGAHALPTPIVTTRSICARRGTCRRAGKPCATPCRRCSIISKRNPSPVSVPSSDTGCSAPYPDGNGRMARFLMNAMLASGGYPWTVIRVEDRDAYLAALDRASIDMNIEPFAAFIAERVRWSMKQTNNRAGDG